MLLKSRRNQDDYQENSFMKTEKNKLITIYSLIVIITGLLLLFLKEKWHPNTNFFYKLIIYCLTGMSLSYTIIFGIWDFINFIIGYFQTDNSKSIIETEDQILSLLTICFIWGKIYGLIFSFITFEYVNNNIVDKFNLDTTIALPLGIIFGIIGGIINEVLRENSGKFNLVLNDIDPYNIDI